MQTIAFSADNTPLDAEYGYQSVALPGDRPFRAFMHGAVDIPFHWHPELEVVMSLRGSINLLVAGQQCLLAEGDVMIINANVIHNSVAWSPDAILCGVHLDAEYFDNNGLPGFARREFLCKSFLHGKQFDRIAQPIKAIVSRLVLNAPDRPDEAMARNILADMLCYFIYRRVPWNSPENHRNPRGNGGRQRVVEIMRNIRLSERQNMNLSDIAVAEGLTLSHLSRLFKSCVGIGFREYVQNLKLDRTLQKLRTTRHTISEVIEEAGFTNSTHFFAKFRERFGCSPAEYRKLQTGSVGHAAVPEEDRQDIADRLGRNIAWLPDACTLIAAIQSDSADKLQFSAPHNLELHIDG
ncbi:helix-turn-helix domain-containing protein [Rhizobium sp. 2YAF20]|uniref:AraC family transcriptional regulator n=1 Tax=Rhizobium sp. 2YAF20 TaxID=3233027 RepID=UPI003F95457C